MLRKVRVGLAALGIVALGASCTPKELHVWGAQIRGAPVTNIGGNEYVTGGATRDTREHCASVVMELEPWIAPWNASTICGANYRWTWGSLGFTQNILDP